jgi:hypothetical protein
MALLDNLSEYADKLDKKAVVDKVWPDLVREPSLLCCYVMLIRMTSNLALQIRFL